MKSVIWITGDYFIDVDRSLVPYLQKNYPEWHIDWIVIKSANSNIQVPTNTPTKIYQLKYRGKDPRIFLEYYKIIKCLTNEYYDIIYSDYVGYPYYYPILLKKAKKPVVHAAHNVIPYEVWSKSLRNFVHYIFLHNNYFQLFSKFTAEYFKEHYPNKSFFYAPMVVKDFGFVRTDHYHFDEEKINLLFFGNIVANKRLDLLIEAMKSLPVTLQEKVQLNICGNCKNGVEYYKNLIGKCSYISTHFRRIPDEDVPELFTKSQFLMLPYQDVAQSGPHMIAYNYNLPVIASNIPGFTERVENGINGFIFNVDDKKSLTNAIVKAITMEKDEYTRMKQSLSEYVKRSFSLKSVASKYIIYFNSII